MFLGDSCWVWASEDVEFTASVTGSPGEYHTRQEDEQQRQKEEAKTGQCRVNSLEPNTYTQHLVTVVVIELHTFVIEL